MFSFLIHLSIQTQELVDNNDSSSLGKKIVINDFEELETIKTFINQKDRKAIDGYHELLNNAD